MSLAETVLVYSAIAGFMSILLILFTIFFEKNKKKSRVLLIWSVLFLASSFATSEYALWVDGYNLFDMVFGFNFPLIVYFGVWFVFLVWLFESRGERKIWIILLILLIIVVLIAINCMNCIKI